MAAKKIEKTNAARLLDRAKIPYTLIPYEVDEEDCRDLLVVASAWTALAAMTGALEASQPTPVSFSAGDLSVTAARGEGGNACAESLRRQAELVMTPYVQDGAFAFLEVEG